MSNELGEKEVKRKMLVVCCWRLAHVWILSHHPGCGTKYVGRRIQDEGETS